jgi:hypothetical protein
MTSRAWEWNDLHEDHMREKLSEVDPFQARIAASSPYGVSDDLEFQVWKHNVENGLRPRSLEKFQERAQFLRHRLREALNFVEPLCQSLTSPVKSLETRLPQLQAAYCEFLAFRRSPLAWQDLHSEDAQLLSKAAILLRTFSVPRAAPSKTAEDCQSKNTS